MREIKFRQPMLNHKNEFIRFHYWGYTNTGTTEFTTPVWGGDISQQYIGFKDKNGVEIFEGDVVTGGGIIMWNESAAEFIVNFPGIEAQGMEGIDEWAEVIGNIHQNKELLKSDK